jgi:hypothetical protein
MRRLLLALTCVCASFGCGETTSRDLPDGVSGSSSTSGTPGAGTQSGGGEATSGGTATAGTATAGTATAGTATAGTPSAGGAGAEAGAGGSDNPGPSCKRPSEAPGLPISEPTATGQGACSGVTLADAIAQARVLRPDLDDVTLLAAQNSDPTFDGSRIYAFQRPDGGFDLVFKRGSGDCPAGCIYRDYFYFATNTDCEVELVGEHHSHNPSSCIPTDQLPRWDVPPAALPNQICDADLTPQDLTGRYGLVTCGSALACALSGDKTNEAPLPVALDLSITQDPSDLSQGTITLDGSGEPLLDGKTFPATFQRRSFAVYVHESNLPAMCPEEWSLSFDYDFEGLGPRHLSLTMMQTPDCAKPDDYCKGYVNADFGDSFAPP